MSQLTTGRLLALVGILLAATFGVTFLVGRATRSSKPTETEVAPLQVSTAVLVVPTVRSVAALPPLKRPPKRSNTTGSVTPASTTGSVSPSSTTGSTTGTPSAGTGGTPSGSTTGGGGGTTTE